MKKLLKFIVFIAITCNAIVASAAGVGSGKVTAVIINSSNYLFFATAAKSGSPGCDTNNQWAISLDTAKGKSIYASLLLARSLDKEITVVGNGTCAVWGDREDVLYMFYY